MSTQVEHLCPQRKAWLRWYVSYWTQLLYRKGALKVENSDCRFALENVHDDNKQVEVHTECIWPSFEWWESAKPFWSLPFHRSTSQPFFMCLTHWLVVYGDFSQVEKWQCDEQRGINWTANTSTDSNYSSEAKNGLQFVCPYRCAHVLFTANVNGMKAKTKKMISQMIVKMLIERSTQYGFNSNNADLNILNFKITSQIKSKQ